MNPGGGGDGESRLCHCTPGWVTEQNCEKERERKKENNRLDKENVVHIHHEILCSYKKEQDHVLCGNMDGAPGYYPKQISTRTEHQTLYVLT